QSETWSQGTIARTHPRHRCDEAAQCAVETGHHGRPFSGWHTGVHSSPCTAYCSLAPGASQPGVQMLDRRIRIKATHDFDDFFNRAYAIQRVSLCVPAGEKKARPRLLTNLV
ncbi:MAG: hypothetical protein WBM63_04920, partial [Sedimenticolaceae bacterium]